jgi:hypothetical protein
MQKCILLDTYPLILIIDIELRCGDPTPSEMEQIIINRLQDSSKSTLMSGRLINAAGIHGFSTGAAGIMHFDEDHKSTVRNALHWSLLIIGGKHLV